MTRLPADRKPYSEYRDSGVDWLGHIPAHWELRPLKRLAHFRAGMTITSDDIEEEGEYPVFGGNGIRGFTDSYTHDGQFPLVGRQGALCGCVNFAVGRFWASEHAVVADPDRAVNPRWLAALLEAMELNQFSQSAAQPGLAIDSVSVLQAPLPSIAEQRAIVAFLDRETARIDALVAKKERLIELLQEQRTALITRAVTKGFDPNVPMKETGIPWLGTIPAHWEAVRMWRVGTSSSGGTPSRDEPEYWNGRIPWVSAKDMKRRHINSSEEMVTDRAVREAGLRLIAPPAILVVVRGMILAHTFPVAITTVPLTINQDMKAIRLGRGADTGYMAWVLEGIGSGLLASVVDEAAHGTRAIRMDQWRLVTLPVPPRGEQLEIAAALDQRTAHFDKLASLVREVIERLKELRTTLVVDAVTGRIDVRSEVA